MDYIEATAAPVWIRLPEATRVSGLSRSKLYELLRAGAIRSASLRDAGQKHATRLIDRKDLLAYIEARASGGSATA